MFFSRIRQDRRSSARAGVLKTKMGTIQTPVFMPVGHRRNRQGADAVEQLETIGAEIILANTYHLFLRPGTDVIRRFGSLHRFMAWDKADPDRQRRIPDILARTNARVDEEGVKFRSHLDGSSFFLSPEKRGRYPEHPGFRHPDGPGPFRPYPAARREDEKALR